MILVGNGAVQSERRTKSSMCNRFLSQHQVAIRRHTIGNDDVKGDGGGGIDGRGGIQVRDGDVLSPCRQTFPHPTPVLFRSSVTQQSTCKPACRLLFV
ncbi:hypothetical protein X798_01789, partial [Onchocerca flexuosa]